MATRASDGAEPVFPQISVQPAGVTSVRGSARRIVTLDASSDRRRRLEAAVDGIHPRPQHIVDPHGLSPVRRATDLGIALVGVDAPDAASAALEMIATLAANGFTVLCYGDGASAWSLGAHCRLLLAGASCVLDSAAASFVSDMRDSVEQWFTSEAERLDDDRRLQQRMRDGGVVGVSAGMTTVFRWVDRVSALSDIPVLVAGETGTGKELVARAIHARDPRRSAGPFVPVNCAAISAGLAESELFGHRRGAFTGALRDRLGLVRAARGGVLFLDEIGDLEPSLQAKLLRVLQERRLLTLGEDHEVPVDVRVIAATNRDLEAMVTARTFRADLFHRLNALSVHIPPLRERPEDIEPLIGHFLDRYAEPGAGLPVPAPTRPFLEALSRAELPGNVRQLENVVRRAIVNRRAHQPLALSDLPSELLSELAERTPVTQLAAVPASTALAPMESTDRRAVQPGTGWLDDEAALGAGGWKLGRALDLCEQTMVAAALDASHGNRARAARLLGISPRSIFNKMRKHRLTA